MPLSHTWLLVLPFAAFAAAFCFGAVAMWFIARRTKISHTLTANGRAIHVESPLGTLDVRPASKLDPRLATLPVYPGAMPHDAASVESVTALRVGGRTFEEISASYWSPHDPQQVWDFYRQQLPDWPRNLDGTLDGKELIFSKPDHVLLVRVARRSDRTIIETCVKPPGYPDVFERNFR